MRRRGSPAAPPSCRCPDARAAGVPVVVDAALLSFPLSELERWSNAGDPACFSAKQFWGPNGGGVVAGERLVADVAALESTGYESGEWWTGRSTRC
jgi:L-seryl-tRNA(Ser) seleniumtransferase